MLFRWIGHSEFRKHEQLIGVMYDAGISTLDQLSVLTGWTHGVVKNLIARIRHMKAEGDDKDSWIKVMIIKQATTDKSATKRATAYTLGLRGMAYVHAMMRDDMKYRESPEGQAMHFIGTNEILVRLLKSGMDRQRLKWLTSTEATDVLVMYFEEIKKELERRTFIRPDAYLSIGEKWFWIEYDNDTERTRKLERKFHNYVQTLIPVPNASPDPVVWVCPTTQRRDYLQDQWQMVVELFYQSRKIPHMHFFTNGEDTDFFHKIIND